MRIKPLGNRVVLQKRIAKETTKSGIILPDSAKEKPQEATVVALGSATTQVSEGDRVVYSQYAGTEIKLGEEEYMIVSEDDIIAKVE